MSIQEGMVSEDKDVIKRARSAAKGRVIKQINMLKKILRCDNDGKFVTAEISGDVVQGIMTELKAKHDCFQDLHDRYMAFRAELGDALAEAADISLEAIFENGVSDEFAAATALYSKYSIQVESEVRAGAEAKAREDNGSNLLTEINALKVNYDGKYVAAKTVTESTEDKIRKTAGLVKKELEMAINKYTFKIEEFKSTPTSKEGESKFKPAEDCATTVAEANQMMLLLDSVAVNYTASLAPATDRDAVNADRKNIVKLEKMSCPKFTGSPRDFAQWKREFEALVMVPGRSDIEVGGNLLHAIPQKHQRLINHLQLANHKEMMDILALEFGRSRLVVDDIVGQIEKIKPNTTD